MMIMIHCLDSSARISVSGRSVYTAPEMLEQTKSACPDAGEIRETALLRDLAEKPSIGWRLGLKQTEESAKTVKKRASALAKLLLAEKDNCVVIGPENFLPFLIRALEKNGCCIRRSGSGEIRPGEKIRVTEKKDHCGGCQHNCLLSNPGCGVGRDKASRGY